MLERHKDAVYRQMIRMCGNREDAEDTLIEAIMAAYRASDSLRSEEAFRGWLSMIGRRVCIRMRKREALTPVMALADVEVPSEETPQDEVARNEMKGCVQSAVAALPPMYRSVYVLREIEEVPAEEVAERLGLTVAAVKSRLHRARKMVREALDNSICAAQ